uniref:Integrase, catalytic region, zinc finger, CCHC-type, peptidase aspartic, catalytic n=1 Tax=Tanacetum cinerariifolium TaxID=118510 RepID=A0A6L2JH90_TANCI|nr:integrase, catalytic region, zinc finger, CCHC-type, peptidase aspartic, catalytic [Tanacetum cinerariifolium]
MEPNNSWGSSSSNVPSLLIACRLSKSSCACVMGKSTKKTHKPKYEDTNQEKLYLLHMDLYGPMRVESVNGKNKLLDLSFFHVFGALCYPTNDSENLGKLQPKADIGIFIGYAPTKKAFRIYNRRTRRIMETIHVDFDELTAMAFEQRSSGPALNEMTHGTITPKVIAPIAEVIPPVHADSTGSPSSTTIDQDAPSTSKSHTTTEMQSSVIPQDGRDDNLDMEVAHIENDLLFGVPIPEVTSTQSSSTASPQSIVQTNHPMPHHNMDTPMVEKSKLDEDREGKDIDPSHYHSMIGSFLYLTASRPDLQFAICMCARTIAPTIEQQVALDEALVPSTQRLRIGRSNFRLPSDIQSKESTLQVVYDVLRSCPFFKAFLVTADQGGFGTDEGTGSKPGVPDVPSDDSEEEISWNYSDDKDADAQEKNKDDYESDKKDESDDGEEDDDDERDDDDDDEEIAKTDEQDDAERDSQRSSYITSCQRSVNPKTKQEDDDDERDDDDDDEEIAKTDEQDDAERGGDDDEETESDEESDGDETREEESFNPIPRTFEDSKDDGNGEEDQVERISEEEMIHEEEEADELYRYVDINQGRGLQLSQDVEDSHVTLTPVHPDGQQESSSVLKSLEANFSEYIQTNPFAEAVSNIPGIVHQYMNQQMNEAVRVRIIKEQVEGQVKEQVSKILPRIEQSMNAQLEAEVLTRLSHSSRTSYAVAADLSEMELKKILIEKMEDNKSIQCSNEQRNLYKALVEAYEADKIILDTYVERVILKRRRDDDDDQGEGTSAGSERGSKRHREGKESESASAPLQTATKGVGKSTSRVDTLTPELLAGPTYELMKGSCNSLTELEYHLEEVYKATTDQLDWVNPEGQQYPHNLLQPLPLIPDNRGCRVIPFAHFINNDLEYLWGGASSKKYTTSVTKTKAADYGHIKWIEDLVPHTMWIQEPINHDKHVLWGVSHWGRKCQQFYEFAVNRESALDVYSKRRIIAFIDLKIVEWHNYKHLDWISVRRDDDNIYKFKEGYFKRLRL